MHYSDQHPEGVSSCIAETDSRQRAERYAMDLSVLGNNCWVEAGNNNCRVFEAEPDYE
jgi:hypothetical protein